jgi:predicted HicB family RNase H-like nuclease
MRAMQQKFGVVVQWSAEDEAFVATSPEFPGLTGVDPDQNTAIAELREAIEMALEVMAEEGQEPPTVLGRPDYSGQFRLRLRRSTHASLVERAGMEGVSLNALVTSYIDAALERDVFASRAAQELRSAILFTVSVLQGPLTNAPSTSTTKTDLSELSGNTTLGLSSADTMMFVKGFQQTKH